MSQNTKSQEKCQFIFSAERSEDAGIVKFETLPCRVRSQGKQALQEETGMFSLVKGYLCKFPEF